MPQSRRNVRWLAAGIVPVVVLPLVGLAAADAGASPASGRVALPGSAPRWVAGLASPGAAAAGSSVDVQVFLAPKGGQQALDAAASAVSTPGNPQYRHFVTPEQFRQRFEPTDQTVDQVRNWLSSNGFHVTGVESSHRYLTAHGDAAAAQRAFAVSLRNFRHNGYAVQAPTTDATVPAEVAGLVTGVTGLDTEPQIASPGALAGDPGAPPPAGYVNAEPCSQYYGQIPARYRADHKTPLPAYQGQVRPYAVCGYTPKQLRTAYGVGSTSLTGKGARIGIIDAYAAPAIRADANTYAARHGEPGFTAGQFSQSNAGSFSHAAECDPSGWYGEETLDVEAAHGIAPAAGVHYYGATSCYVDDLYSAFARSVDENKVDIISNSWLSPDESQQSSALRHATQLFQQAAMQGISVLFCSGDDGDERAVQGVRETVSPASNPYVTSVGGTAAAIGASGRLDWQSGWGTRMATLSKNGTSWGSAAFLYGAGGGESGLFPEPGYQHGVVPANKAGGRAVPDVAMDADPTTGMLVGETQAFGKSVRYGEYRSGGTSLASPLMAGMVALVRQRAGRLGFLNPAIYASVRSDTGQFSDVKAVHVGDANVRADYTHPETGTGPLIYTVRTFGQDSSLSLRNGWDETTGVGSPNAEFLTGFGG